MPTGKPFRHSAAFGKRIEYWIVGLMLKEGLDVYIPLVDDQAVDAIVKRSDGSTALVQIKARSKDVVEGGAGLFAAIPHPETREDYWFVFFSERMNVIWIMTSDEFITESRQNKQGKNVGLRSIWFNGTRKNKLTGVAEEYCHDRYLKYRATDFGRIAKPRGLTRRSTWTRGLLRGVRSELVPSQGSEYLARRTWAGREAGGCGDFRGSTWETEEFHRCAGDERN